MGREQDWKEIEKTQLNYEQGLKDQYKGIDIVIGNFPDMVKRALKGE